MTGRARPKRFAYADPPYVGLSKRHYRDHPDYGGEVDHAALVAGLGTYDGWALSCSAKSLPGLLALCPPGVLVLAWVKPHAVPMGDGRMYNWEPVIMVPVRRPATFTATALICSSPGYTFRPRPPSHVIGEKPAEFSRWLFAAAGLRSDDEFVDLFPGSGAVGAAWLQQSLDVRMADAWNRAVDRLESQETAG